VFKCCIYVDNKSILNSLTLSTVCDIIAVECMYVMFGYCLMFKKCKFVSLTKHHVTNTYQRVKLKV